MFCLQSMAEMAAERWAKKKGIDTSDAAVVFMLAMGKVLIGTLPAVGETLCSALYLKSDRIEGIRVPRCSLYKGGSSSL